VASNFFFASSPAFLFTSSTFSFTTSFVCSIVLLDSGAGCTAGASSAAAGAGVTAGAGAGAGATVGAGSVD